MSIRINKCACLGHLERSAAESRDLVTVQKIGLVCQISLRGSTLCFVSPLRATLWPFGRNDKHAIYLRNWYKIIFNGYLAPHPHARITNLSYQCG
jgi:hypothetical protein